MPFTFGITALGEPLLSPTAMLLRNLAAMEAEELIRRQPMDAVVLLGGCDKTVPAQLMAAVSAGRPALLCVSGPMLTGAWRGQRLGACTDCRRLWADHRGGVLDADEIAEVEQQLAPTAGTCMVMGTASTMACVTEALGLMLPGGATAPAADRRPAAPGRRDRPAGGRARHATAARSRPRSSRTPRCATRSSCSARSAARRTPSCTSSRSRGGRGARWRSTTSAASRGRRRCSWTASPPARAGSRTSTAPAACPSCSRRSPRGSTSTPPRATGARWARRSATWRRRRTGRRPCARSTHRSVRRGRSRSCAGRSRPTAR